MSRRQRGVVDSLLAESDSLRHFLQERVQVDPYGDVIISQLVEVYAAYCPEHRWQALPITEVQRPKTATTGRANICGFTLMGLWVLCPSEGCATPDCTLHGSAHLYR